MQWESLSWRPNVLAPLRSESRLEHRLRELQRSAEQLARETQRDVSGLRAELHTESSARVNSDAKIEGLLQEFAVGGLHLEWVGLWWLLIGTAATSIESELATLFRWLA